MSDEPEKYVTKDLCQEISSNVKHRLQRIEDNQGDMNRKMEAALVGIILILATVVGDLIQRGLH